MTEAPPPLHLFEGYGIELEYMIVSREHLDVRPIVDELLRQVAGEYAMEVECGEIAWSNELALHVIELKTNGPARDLTGLDALFQSNIERINGLLEPMGALVLPTAMHPWMNPFDELRLWPHENDVIYETFNRIFDCRGHGWANLQSAHINLPFANDAEFAALHAAIRLVLPLIPGLAASSPIIDGRISKLLDTRLEIYRTNARRVPSVSGIVIPERVFSRREYEDGLLARIYADLAPLDPEGVLRHEWVNARGAIARFDRMAIEIRIVDVQECPAADVAVASAVVAAVRCLVEEHWASSREQREWDERRLAAVLAETTRRADTAVIDDQDLLRSFGFRERGRARLGDVWQHLIESLMPAGSTRSAQRSGQGITQHAERHAGQPAMRPTERPAERRAEPREVLDLIVSRGCLARRIVDALGPEPDRDALEVVYRRLADCVAQGTSFIA